MHVTSGDRRPGAVGNAPDFIQGAHSGFGSKLRFSFLFPWEANPWFTFPPHPQIRFSASSGLILARSPAPHAPLPAGLIPNFPELHLALDTRLLLTSSHSPSNVSYMRLCLGALCLPFSLLGILVPPSPPPPGAFPAKPYSSLQMESITACLVVGFT